VCASRSRSGPRPHPRAPGDRRRGFIKDFIIGQVKAYVLKYVAGVAADQAMKYLERNVRRGLVVMKGLDPSRWARVETVADVTLPTDRPARLLLFLHGTFSSTAGSFGALGATPWGRAFLEATWASYDAVVGFDHPTLSEDPAANARDLVERLKRPWAFAPRLDVLTYSRGGLVLRSLAEDVLPRSEGWEGPRARGARPPAPAYGRDGKPLPAGPAGPGPDVRPRLGSAVFVAVPNGGTSLAEPDNWARMADLYTNLAFASCHLLALMPYAQPAVPVLKEVIRSLGALVKYMASYVVTEGNVPGLAAMEPDGAFLRALGRARPGGAAVGPASAYAITSEFEARVLGGDHEPKELPLRLVQALADGFVDQLMRAANDLVVDTDSMTRLSAGALKDLLQFGKTPYVYHLTYVFRPEVFQALSRWLGLRAPAEAEAPPAEAPAPAARGWTRGPSRVGPAARAALAPPPALAPAAQDLAEPGVVVRPPAPAALATDILVARETDPAGEVIEAIEAEAPGYVVVRRREGGAGGPRYEYAYAAEELLAVLRKAGADAPLNTVLTLHENTSSSPLGPGDLTGSVATNLPTDPKVPTAGRAVVLEGGEPVGVLPSAADVPDLTRLVDLAWSVAAPKDAADRRLARRMAPTRRAPTNAPPAAAEAPAPARPKTRGPSSKGGGTRLGMTDESAPKSGVTRGGGAKGGARSPGRDRRGAEPVTCHFHAAMDAEVLVRRVTTVDVIVAREPIDRPAGAASAGASGAVRAGAKLALQVIPRAHFEVVGESRKEVDPPTPDRPLTEYFDVRPTHLGDGELWVEVTQEQVPVATLSLRPRIVATRPGSYRQTGAEARSAEPARPSAPVNQLIIFETVRGADTYFTYQLHLPARNVFDLYESPRINGDKDAYVTGLFKKIEDYWVSNKDDEEALAADLRSFGGSLWDQLFPTELRAKLYRYRDDIRSIMIVSTEPFIPWELVHLKDEQGDLTDETMFLGQFGAVRWLHNTLWPPETLRVRKGKARYVIPHYPREDWELPEAEEESKFLEDTFGAAAVEPHANPVRKLIREPGAFDLLHFACHGEAEQDNIADARLLLEGRFEGQDYVEEPLIAETVGQYGRFEGPDHNRAVVVLNACQAGRSGYRLTGVGGFAQAFLKGRAGAFVGTLWSVGDRPARAFTEALYQALLDGDDLAQAGKKAREAARAGGDATWMAYVLYGHPNARLTT